ncbi:MAG: sulfatase [Planctomycetota bacterium]
MRAAAFAVTALALLAGCGSGPPRPTVVLVTLDTTRAQNLSTYGYRRATDPFLASLAEQSRVFERAYSTTTWTLPSHVSMFTGLVPAEHGVWFRIEIDGEVTTFPRVGDQQPMFTRALSEAGYRLVGAVGGPYCRALYGLARDFDEYEEPESVERAGQGGEWQLTGRELNARLFEHLRATPADQPLFVFANYFDAHAPYEPPQDRDYPFPEAGELSELLDPDALPIPMPDLTEWVAEGREILPEYAQLAETLYDQELLLQDEALSALWTELDRLGRLDDALVIITADHGEMFGEQPLAYGHSSRPWEPVTRVPLLVFRSGHAPARIEGPVSVTQVATTILQELDLAPLPEPLDGPLPSLLSGSPVPDDAYAELHTPDDWVTTLHRGDHKLWSEYLVDEQRLDPPRHWVIDAALEDAELLSPASIEALPPPSDFLIGRITDLRAEWAAAPDLTARVRLSTDDIEGLKRMGYVED